MSRLRDVKLINKDNSYVDGLHPLPISLDRIYAPGIDETYSDIGDFSGVITDFMDSLKTVSVDSTANNPKVLKFWLKRSTRINQIALGCDDLTKSFSNVVFKALGSGEVVRYTKDLSNDSTKRNSYVVNLPNTDLNGFILEFHTADAVGLSNVLLFKVLSTVSSTQALTPQGDVGDVSANENSEFRVALSQFTAVNILGSGFDGTTKDSNFWTETVTGSGTVTQSGEIALATGTTANSTAKYTTVYRGRFIPGTPHEFRAIVELYTDPDIDNIRRIGPYDDNNGFFAQLDGEAVSFVVRSDRSGSVVDDIIESGDFNGYSPTYTPTSEAIKLNIKYGGKVVFFFIDNNLYHTVRLGHDSRPSTLTLPITMENINDNGNDTDNEFHCFSAAIYSLGEIRTEGNTTFLSANGTYTLKYGAGVLCQIVNCDNAGSVTIYDNTAASGTILATIDTAKALGYLPFNARCSTGITVVVAGGAKVSVRYE